MDPNFKRGPFTHERYCLILLEDYEMELPGLFDFDPHLDVQIDGGWVRLVGNILKFRAGYAWNGPDVIRNWKRFDRASMGHDGGLQLLAAGLLPISPWKKRFDDLFEFIARMDGVGPLGRALTWAAVRIFGRGKDKYMIEEND